MSFRRRLSSATRFHFVRWSAIITVYSCVVANAQPPSAPPSILASNSEITPIAPAEVQEEATVPAGGPGLTGKPRSATRSDLAAPIKSTLELRFARRPWLLEKLSGKTTVPSRKMDLPQPPVELPDPPSMSRIAPQGKPKQMRPAPLRDPVPPSKSISDDSLVPLVEPDSESTNTEKVNLEKSGNERIDQVIVDSAEPTRAETERKSSDIDTDVNDVVVRQLSIEGDGSAVQKNESHKSESDKSFKLQLSQSGDKSNSARDQEELPSEEREPSQYIGDLQESEATETLAPQIPKRSLDYIGYPREPIELTRDVIRMQGMMQKCLRYYYNRPEIANERSNWGMMHAIMVYGIDTKVIVGRKRYSSIAWIAGNNICRGQRLLAEKDGKITAKTGVGLQGHQAQLLAVLSLAGVPEDYALYAGKTPYTVGDLVDSEMLACKDGEELTFTLIGLSHYLDTESEWRNSEGETWDFERLIREELSQPIVGSACGGTHRLLGFAHALRARRAEGLPIAGQWKRAEQYVQSYIPYTYRLQNRDGSMSTDWFAGREDNGELDRKVQTTGHMVEWLLTVTPDSQLQNPKLVSAIRFLLKSMYAERDREWKIGPKGHALRSLAMYYERVFQSGSGWQSVAIARSGTGSRNGSRSSRRR